MPLVRVVMPAHNEAACIEEVVRAWLAALPADAELEVVDDGSTDATATLLAALHDPRLRVVRQPNRGHGPTIAGAYRRACDDGVPWVFQTDSDGQLDPADFGRLWALRETAPFVHGVRAVRHDPAHRRVISSISAVWLRALFGVSVKDPNVPFRLLRTDALAPLLDRLPADTFAPNLFLSAMAAPLVEVEVRHHARAGGQTHLPGATLLRRCVQVAADLARFRLAARRAPGGAAPAPAPAGTTRPRGS
jgi:dolichol-phosphate mannosyltransferase